MITSLNANFFQSLDAMQLLFFWLGVISSALFVVQVLFLLIPSSFSLPGKENPPFLSEKTVTAFLAVGSWCGFISSFYFDEIWQPVLISVCFGAAAFVGAGFLMKSLVKIQRNIFESRFAGADAIVSAKIPPERKGHGKITLLIRDNYEKLDAITDEKEEIPAGSPVKILEYTDDYALVCRLEKTKIGAAARIEKTVRPETGTSMGAERRNSRDL